MKATFILAALLLGPSAWSSEPADLPFDQGVPLPDSGEIRASAVPDAPIASASAVKAMRDCAVVHFAPTDGKASQPVTLSSPLYRQVCRKVEGQNVCEDELLRTETRNVIVEFKGPRKPQPWEKDVFSVCLQSTDLSLRVLAASHEYGRPRLRGSKGSFIFELPILRKIATAPDASGIYVESFAPDASIGGLRFVLKDKWATPYKGEITAIKLRLKRDIENRIDSTVMEQELLWPASETYDIPFPAWLFLKELPAQGKKYFVEWEFSRRGQISLQDFQKKGQTARVGLPKPPSPSQPAQ